MFTRGCVVLLVMLASACGGSSPSSPSTPPPTPSPFANLVGNYTLTLEIDESCAVIPQSERIRKYDAIVVDEPWEFPSYRPIQVVGGGFKQFTTMGALWSDGNSKFRLVWNNVDIGGCDNGEALTDSRQLYICGSGAATAGDSTISAAIAGNAAISGSGYCTGSHRFTFVRHPQ